MGVIKFENDSFDIVITGGGVPALAGAVIFSKLGLKVLLVARGFGKSVKKDTARKNISYAISPSNIKLFERCGLKEEFFKISEDVSEMHLFEDDSCLKLSSDLSPHGYLSKIVYHDNLYRLLVGATQSLKTFHSIDGSIDDIGYTANGQCRVRVLTGGKKSIRKIQANLLVVADGASSVSRHILKIPWGIKNYCQKAVLANFSSALQPNIARQWFSGDEVIALLPTSKNSVSMVWSQNQLRAERLMREGKSRLRAELSRILGTSIMAQIEINSEMVSTPLSMMTVDKLVSRRIVLLGDSAHTVHPLAGLGLNIGLFDILTLVNEFEKEMQVDRPFDVGSSAILGSYMRARLLKTRAIQSMIDTIKVGFSTGGYAAKFLRTKGMSILQQSDFFKRYIVKFASSIL